MNAELLTKLLFGVASLASLIPGGAGIAPIITILEQAVPVAVKEYQDLKPIVKDIIATLKGNPAATVEQIDALDAMEAKLDADFDAAAAAAEAEDG